MCALAASVGSSCHPRETQFHSSLATVGKSPQSTCGAASKQDNQQKKHDSPLQGSSLPVVSNMLWVDGGLTLMCVHMGIPAACGCVAFKLALFFNCKHNHGH